MKLVITNGRLVTPMEDRFADIFVNDGTITALGDATTTPDPDTTVIDATDCWVTPGLIDLQVNGGPQCDFWADPQPSQVAAFGDSLVRAGVTAILPTLITDDLLHLRKNLDFLEKEIGVGREQLTRSAGKAVARSKDRGSSTSVKEIHLPLRMPGVHLEGPCLSPQKPGVHPPAHLQPLTLDVLKQIVTNSVNLITLAPELDPEGDCIRWLQGKGVPIALGHSNATYEEAERAFDAGIKLVTHTYNALPSIHHRAPGAVTAALLDNRVTCCLICDGEHVAPPAIALAIKAKGISRSILVTDVAHVGTSQGGLVGSSILLDAAVRNVVAWGVASFPDAITMATYNPARAMGWDDHIGHLAPGKQADIVVWDRRSLHIKYVLAGGELLSL